MQWQSVKPPILFVVMCSLLSNIALILDFIMVIVKFLESVSQTGPWGKFSSYYIVVMTFFLRLFDDCKLLHFIA
jgi:hypothetical protein